MNPEPQEFDALRKLLALKRHEQPPPGYYRNFSNNVMSRINAIEGDGESAWLLRLWQHLTARPLVSGAFAAVIAGLFLFGVIFMQGDDTALQTTLTGGQTSPMLMPGLVAGGQDSPVSHLAQGNPEDINSTNPVGNLVQPPSLFGPIKLGIEKVSLQSGGQ